MAAWLVGIVVSIGLVEVARGRADKDKGTPQPETAGAEE